MVKQVPRKCAICKKFEEKPYPSTKIQHLYLRVSDDTQFTHIGVDLAGTFLVKEDVTIDKPTLRKANVTLFASAESTRVVLWELLMKLSTHSCNNFYYLLAAGVLRWRHERMKVCAYILKISQSGGTNAK